MQNRASIIAPEAQAGKRPPLCAIAQVFAGAWRSGVGAPASGGILARRGFPFAANFLTLPQRPLAPRCGGEWQPSGRRLAAQQQSR